jgi:D-glycero-alpha-D-manno-heptose-7-phosphate kinase
MIISRTPLRMSFTGGGSDLPVFYREYGGAVISTAIDKYVYVNVNKKFDSGIRIGYSRNEEVQRVEDIEHQIVRETMLHLALRGGVEITTIADIPSKGTGLGSSSSFAVGLLHALNAYIGKYVSSEQLGKDSCYIEIDKCGEPIGKQDQYAAAFGGFNLIEFNRDDTVVVSPIICRMETLREIENNILVFYTGMTRKASSLLARQSSELSNSLTKQLALRRMVELTYELKRELENNNADAFGEILHENWVLKKSLTDGVSSPEIDNWYSLACGAGALGGKILGAGSGGFLMIYAPNRKHPAIRSALSMLQTFKIGFEPLGSRIIFYH